ncbi:MAG: MarR family transcriptional regulator [Candidatus Aenigmatarchaeota archaeon]
MKTYSLLGFAAIFLIVFSISSYGLEDNQPQKITFLGAEVELGDVSHTILTVTFDPNSTIKTFTLPLFYEIQNLKADSNFGNVSCSQQKKPFGSQIDCKVSPTFDRRMLTLEYDSFDLVTKVDNQFLYKQEFTIPFETTQLSFKAMLPEGMFLSSGGVFQQYLPVNGEKGSDGRRIFVSWRKENLGAGESFDTQISYEATSDNSQIMALFTGGLLGLGAIIVMLIIGFWFFFKRFKRNIKIVLPVLKGDEKTILELIIRDKGNTNQKLLVRESNFSKARVSKILKSLQERGIVKLEREGRGNNVYLVKDFNKEKKESAAETGKKEQKMPKQDFRSVEKSSRNKFVHSSYEKRNEPAEIEGTAPEESEDKDESS